MHLIEEVDGKGHDTSLDADVDDGVVGDLVGMDFCIINLLQ